MSRCGQCGQPYEAWACGPTHAMIAAERERESVIQSASHIHDLASSVKRLAAQREDETGPVAGLLADGQQVVVRALSEGRQALVGALLSELDAAQPDFALICRDIGRADGLGLAEVAMLRHGWRALANHLRAWLEAGAPERPLLNEAWARINALGGNGRRPEYEEAISAALHQIESLGGHDPAEKR